jgi:hypothetical protein
MSWYDFNISERPSNLIVGGQSNQFLIDELYSLDWLSEQTIVLFTQFRALNGQHPDPQGSHPQKVRSPRRRRER